MSRPAIQITVQDHLTPKLLAMRATFALVLRSLAGASAGYARHAAQLSGGAGDVCGNRQHAHLPEGLRL